MTRRNTSTFFTGWTAVAATLKETTPRLLAVGIFLAVCGTASAETWTLSWNPLTTYTDGTPITGKTIIYSLCWSTDPGTLAPMAPISTGVTQTSTTFDPAPQGMIPGRTVYFRMKTALNTGEVSDYSAVMATLDTGEESALSGSLAWRVSNKGPAPPPGERSS
jgi:hypothetical protein